MSSVTAATIHSPSLPAVERLPLRGGLHLDLLAPTWAFMQNLVLWHVSARRGDLQCGGLPLARILCNMPLRAHGGRIRGDDESMFPATNPRLLLGIRQSDMREAGKEGDVSEATS